jgi:sulfoxide reductase heme-binding subunit YedZ
MVGEQVTIQVVRGPRLLTGIAIAIGAMSIAIMLVPEPFDVRAHALVRWTARTSLVMFVLAFVARPLVQLRPKWRIGKWLLAERKWLGLGFAVSHLAHFIGILMLALPDFGAFVRQQNPTILIAALTFVLLFAMAITSIETIKRRIPARAWKRLHRTGMYFAWLAFTATYAGLIAVHPLFALPTLVLLAIASVRIAAFVRGMRKRAVEQPVRSRAA